MKCPVVVQQLYTSQYYKAIHPLDMLRDHKGRFRTAYHRKTIFYQVSRMYKFCCKRWFIRHLSVFAHTKSHIQQSRCQQANKLFMHDHKSYICVHVVLSHRHILPPQTTCTPMLIKKS